MSALSGFRARHIGPQQEDVAEMLRVIGVESLDALIDQTIPAGIRLKQPLNLPEPLSEKKALDRLAGYARRNKLFRSYIGMGYYGTVTPPVLRRNILENPGWYTAYTPYQAEISQGRLEAMLNFQTMVCEITGMDIANASLLDESTAAAEAMFMCRDVKQGKGDFLVAPDCHPQTISLVRTRVEAQGIHVVVAGPEALENAEPGRFFGVLVQYPATDGRVSDLEKIAERAHAAGALLVVAADLLSLALLKPPGECGADVVVGSAQRFGVPMSFGGPHAAFFATRDEYKRRMPGRLVGVSRDADGGVALRLTLQTREQHIRREKATSNICTAQVLLAVMASMYAVYHGPEGLKSIASRVHRHTRRLAAALVKAGWALEHEAFFDTVSVTATPAQIAEVRSRAEAAEINLRYEEGRILLSLDETVDDVDVAELAEIFSAKATDEEWGGLPAELQRTGDVLKHPVFRRYHTETEMMRYLARLAEKDISLTTSMIPLGSCTMKLNAAAEMLPITWPEFTNIHPFVPSSQREGYSAMIADLESWLGEITGLPGVSLQPNAGSQGEYAGLMVIRRHHVRAGQSQRTVCLIPSSAHGTNPASAVLAGFNVVVVRCDARGNIDMDDLRAKAGQHADSLGALMVTYPSTHGVFEETIREVCEIVHAHGGQVYMDGANMNAQAGLCRPGDFGIDVCHLNLHKTFCIPHGGGGPGVGPICVAEHLRPYLPGHSVVPVGGEDAVGEIAQAPWGSAGILPISWMYIAMMGSGGLREASRHAILNANYIAARLSKYFPVLYTGRNGRVAHECIIDMREWKTRAGVEVEDVAKRLMDYGFHAPTMSWPVPGTLMIEPTESESRQEIDRFCDALISIHGELTAIERGELDRENNPLKRAPHTAQQVTSDAWDRPYTRKQAAWPAPWLSVRKYWPPVARVDNVYGDRNVFCSCPPWQEEE